MRKLSGFTMRLTLRSELIPIGTSKRRLMLWQSAKTKSCWLWLGQQKKDVWTTWNIQTCWELTSHTERTTRKGLSFVSLGRMPVTATYPFLTLFCRHNNSMCFDGYLGKLCQDCSTSLHYHALNWSWQIRIFTWLRGCLIPSMTFGCTVTPFVGYASGTR